MNGEPIGLAGTAIALRVDVAPHMDTFGEVLVYFNEILDALSKLAADSELSAKNGAELLDRLLKDTVTKSASVCIPIHAEQEKHIEDSQGVLVPHLIDPYSSNRAFSFRSSSLGTSNDPFYSTPHSRNPSKSRPSRHDDSVHRCTYQQAASQCHPESPFAPSTNRVQAFPTRTASTSNSAASTVTNSRQPTMLAGKDLIAAPEATAETVSPNYVKYKNGLFERSRSLTATMRRPQSPVSAISHSGQNNLEGSISEELDPFDYQSTVNELTMPFLSEFEETRVATLKWLIMLHQKAPEKDIGHGPKPAVGLLSSRPKLTSREEIKSWVVSDQPSRSTRELGDKRWGQTCRLLLVSQLLYTLPLFGWTIFFSSHYVYDRTRLLSCLHTTTIGDLEAKSNRSLGYLSDVVPRYIVDIMLLIFND
ncbi:hypothetical protein D9757_010879 [Collybiopsis confluens]|uniref:Uncharacterized protein n=1 Tax=Collybiopsis confluens TaxID=2823264 RepID=A0A8H5H7Y6_9AGAR|nr:hypothetical protein D9757_010879 [Collybiopsis confluens]